MQEVPERVSPVMQRSGMATLVSRVQLNTHAEVGETSNCQNEGPAVHTVDVISTAESEYALEPKHKVFLSHSGAQKDFVEQLCVDLQRLDRYPFFDKLRSSLPIGEKFPKLIFDAIEQCQVGVVVLSEEFFMKGKWPMLELNAMVKEYEKPKSRMKIIPLFYGITVESFKDSRNHNQWILQWEEWASNDKSGRIDVEEWKKAVRTLECINSLVMKEGMGDVKFREKIVEEICKVIPAETRWDDSHVQGRHRNCKVICAKMREVCSSSRVCVVGMYGVGGIGKTTICKALCNELSPRFHDNVCHVELGQGDEMKLLKKALRKLSTISHEILDKLDDVEEGCSYLKKRVRNEPIFLALDNVQDEYKSRQEALTYLKGGYGVGSVVLVTARSKDVLMKLNLEESQCLEMPKLEEDEARSLFSYFAGVLVGSEVDEKLIWNSMQLCHLYKGDGKTRQYHPLALKVLGQQLGSHAKLWEVQLSKIVKVNQVDDAEAAIFSILRNSFESLERIQQLVFMDLALISNRGMLIFLNELDWLCMVHGGSVEDMKDVLDVLKRKSLVEDLSGDYTKMGMHDLWREFAVLESKPQDSRDRLWVYQANGKRALGRRGRWKECVERMCFLDEGWSGLQGLNLADFGNVEVFVLDIRMKIRDCSLDLDLSGLKHLKSLCVRTSELAGRVGGLSSLTNLVSLYWSSRGFSPRLDKIGRLRNLQVLGLSHCKGVKVLDLSELTSLRVVWISMFPDLISLRGLSSRMASLQVFDVYGCDLLKECWGLDELHALKVLKVEYCGKLRRLPWLGQLVNFRELSIDGCKSMKSVQGLSDLVALEELNMWGCSKLAALPNLVKLTRLQKLDIGYCPVQELPGLGGLVALTSFKASFDKLLGEPLALSMLSTLKVLTIFKWDGPVWASIQNLVMLEELRFLFCKGEDVVPDLVNLRRLRSVDIEYCNLKDLSGLSHCTSLESLRISCCRELVRLPDLSRLAKLRALDICYCSNLRSGPYPSNLSSLKQLSVDGISLMTIVQDLEFLSGLQELKVNGEGCENVLSMPWVSELESLNIWFARRTELLDVSNLP